MFGAALTHWTIRLALLCLVARLAGNLWYREDARWFAWSRTLWTAGCLLFVGHVAAAFHFYHHWSHAHAFEKTAHETHEMLGVRFGEGIYFSYLFLILWVADVAWLWLSPASYRSRSAWMAIALVSYMGFIAFNGAVVFEDGTTRLFGIPLTVGLVIVSVVAWLARRSSYSSTSEDSQPVLAKDDP